MDGDPAHKAALRLAETGVYVGQQVGDRYFFQPDATVSRAQFLTMAMAAVGLEPLDQVSLTGFARPIRPFPPGRKAPCPPP